MIQETGEVDAIHLRRVYLEAGSGQAVTLDWETPSRAEQQQTTKTFALLGVSQSNEAAWALLYTHSAVRHPHFHRGHQRAAPSLPPPLINVIIF